MSRKITFKEAIEIGIETMVAIEKQRLETNEREAKRLVIWEDEMDIWDATISDGLEGD